MDDLELESLFDLERSDIETTYLSEHGQRMIVEWAEALWLAGYDLVNGDHTSYMQAAGFLIANNESDYDVEYTAIALTFLGDKWEEIKAVFDGP